MHARRLLITLLIAAVGLVGCSGGGTPQPAGGGQGGQAQRPGSPAGGSDRRAGPGEAQAPGAGQRQQPGQPGDGGPQRPGSGQQESDRMAEGAAPVGGQRTPAGQRGSAPAGLTTPPAGMPEGRLPAMTPPAGLPVQPGAPPAITPPPITPPPATIVPGEKISSEEAVEIITTFAQEYLGAAVTVRRAAGTSGTVNVPEAQQSDLDAAVSVAGETVAGVIELGGAMGGAQVSLGSGDVSGDVDAEISSASLGAYSVIANAPAPADADAALGMIYQYYPALAALSLELQSSEQGGYIFYATTTHTAVDPQTRQTITVAEAVVAGTTAQGSVTVVWAVVGNGAFAQELSIPR